MSFPKLVVFALPTSLTLLLPLVVIGGGCASEPKGGANPDQHDGSPSDASANSAPPADASGSGDAMTPMEPGAKAALASSAPIVPLGTMPARVINAADVKLPDRLWGYAYGPAIVKEPRPGGGVRYHAFVCSTGVTNGTIDKIRYTHSDDGLHWSAPVIKISASGNTETLDYSACDPSIIRFGEYWYLYYSGARGIHGPTSCPTNDGLVAQTVVRIARSKTIDGNYEVLTQDAGNKAVWVPANPGSPPPNPTVIVGPRHVVCGTYGAGQQSVLVKDDRIYMWYVDDTAKQDGTPVLSREAPRIYMMSSTDPIKWHFYQSTLTTNSLVALDVKYDARAKAFVQIAVPTAPNGISEIVGRYSYDGIDWAASRKWVDRAGMPKWSRVEAGLSGDASGHLSDGNTLVGFACPHDHCLEFGANGPAVRPANGYWDLWGFYTADLSHSLFEP